MAGTIGEASQSEPIKIELIASVDQLASFPTIQTKLKEDESISIKSNIYLENGTLKASSYEDSKVDVRSIFKYSNAAQKVDVITILSENNATKEAPFHASFKFAKDGEAKKITENKGDGKNYEGTFIIEEIQSEREYQTFLFIFILTAVFGALIILLLKPLKRLTHGAEDSEMTA